MKFTISPTLLTLIKDLVNIETDLKIKTISFISEVRSDPILH